MSLPEVAIPFVKAVACGNDFLLIEAANVDADLRSSSGEHNQQRLASLAGLTRRICDRHEGIGADGVEWLYPHASADLEIRLINADGSEAEISGNGTRCVAAYVCAERGQEKITILTGAGIKSCVLTGRSDSEFEFEADMGAAAVGAEFAVQVDQREVSGIPVSMGNPHFVVFVDKFTEKWQEEAATIQRSSQFAQHGVNVEFVAVDGKHDVRTRFFERGVGETQSSGTGSCASAAAAITAGKVQSPVRVHAPGGIQTVRQEHGQIFLRGWARLVCRGEFFLK